MADFDARDLLDCYSRGVFPMADAREDARVFLIDPERRGVIPFRDFHVSRRLARTVRSEPFEIRADSAFHEVVLACAEAGPGRRQTWINRPIERLYVQLHQLGFAHSLECWQGERLVGGLYGVSLNGAFFGESMFSRERDASKVALVHLVARLLAGGYRLLDAQFMTDHLAKFGAQEISRRDYHRRLKQAMGVHGDFYAIGSVLGAGTGVGAGSGDGGAGALAAGASSVSSGSVLGAGAVGLSTTGAGGGMLALQLITQAS